MGTYAYVYVYTGLYRYIWEQICPYGYIQGMYGYNLVPITGKLFNLSVMRCCASEGGADDDPEEIVKDLDAADDGEAGEESHGAADQTQTSSTAFSRTLTLFFHSQNP